MSKVNRRELLVTSVGAAVGGVVGGAGLVLLNACRSGGFGSGSGNLNPGSESGPCPLNPEQEEGPFYVDEGLLRVGRAREKFNSLECAGPAALWPSARCLEL